MSEKRNPLSTLHVPAVALLALGASALLGGCRGNPSDDPPLHWQRQMFTQDKGKPQRENTFFADHRAMRPIEAGTLAASAPVDLLPFHTGKDDAGKHVAKFPAEVTVDEAFLVRGQQRYNIYCAPCHDRTGSGNGLVIQRANKWSRWVPPSYAEQRLIDAPVGELFDTITNGKATMPSYAYQIPIADRWAIVAYVRALQRSQNLPVAALTPEQRSNLK